MAKPIDLSIIIPVAPGADAGPAMRAVAKDIPRGMTAEILTVVGRNPTLQRNMAAMRARGAMLYFLDHDSIVQSGTVSRLMRAMRSAAIAGGPNLAMRPRSRFEEVAARVIGSRLGSLGVSNRYHGEGEIRAVTERSLILCNLMVNREAFLTAGGFDPRLYPNEENELMNRFSVEGLGLVQVPEAAVTKPRPQTLGQFARETFRYGRGRAEQIWVNARWSDLRYVAAATAVLGLAGFTGLHPRVLGVLACLSLALFGEWALPYPPAAFFLAGARYLAYALGMAAGGLLGFRARRVRLADLPVTFRRFEIAGTGPLRLREQHVFNIGAWSKEVPASA